MAKLTSVSVRIPCSSGEKADAGEQKKYNAIRASRCCAQINDENVLLSLVQDISRRKMNLKPC
jgi:hypothetical protein